MNISLDTMNGPLLSTGYPQTAGVYDEMSSPLAVLRPHWDRFINSLSALGGQELARRWQTARQRIRENGVTYNVYGDPLGMDRPWNLDAIPLMIPPSEWSQLEAGLIQRARLLNLILADLYGPQKLLRGGQIPPALLFANPGFLRPCHGVTVPGNTYLHLLAVDLARGPDGEWWVISDRTQAPSGAGYALENRIVMAETFPDLFREFQVKRLASFFRSFRDTLLRLSPTTRDNPRVVLLTPGPFNETYFEHSYLARYLGFTLVQGGDLTVRDSRVFLKTLEGLKQVDVILRRLDDSFCDPIELRSDSYLGVAGLVEAVRAGNVTVANALGSGLIETSAFMPFLPGLSLRMLGEGLKLPTVATWWCGQPKALRYVLDNLDFLVIKPAFPSKGMEPVFGGMLGADERSRLIAHIRESPHEFAGQELLNLSTAPVWSEEHGLTPRRVVLRVYLAAEGDSWVVIPGGLARVSSSIDTPVVSMQRGGGSKDVWVLAPDRRAIDEVNVASAAPRAPAPHDDLPSRLAENLFWLGRYSERCEEKTRLLRATLRVRPNASLWPQVLETCGHFVAPSLFDEVNPLGLSADLQRLGWCAAQARSRLSAENWRAIDVLQREFQDAALAKRDPRETLDALLLSLAGLAGFALDDMTQDDGWRLMMVGRRLERLQFLAELLAQRLESGDTPVQSELEWLLDIGDSTITYRTRYLAAPRLGSTFDLLVFDQTNPRALAFQWHAIEHSLVGVAASLGGSPDDTLDGAVALVKEMQLSAIEDDSPRAVRARQSLALQLTGLAAAAGRLSDRLSLKHFSLIDAEIRTVAA